MPRQSDTAKAFEEKRLEIIHDHQTALRKQLKRELTTKKASKRLPGEENFKKNMAIFLKIGVPGISYGDIGARIGETKTTVKEWFTKDPQVREQYEVISANLKNSGLQLLEFYTIEAIETLVLLMRFGSEKVMMESAIQILDRVGIAKLTKAEVETTNTKKHEWADKSEMIEEIRALPPEKQEEAIRGLELIERALLGGGDLEGEIVSEEDDAEGLQPILGSGDEDDVVDEEDDDASVL